MSRRRRNEQRVESLREAFWAAEDATPARVPDTYAARAAYERDSLSQQVLDAVEKYMTKFGWTQQALARELGVTEGRISQILSGDQNLTLKTLAGLAAGLKAHFTIDLVEPRDGRSEGTPRRHDGRTQDVSSSTAKPVSELISPSAG